MTDSERKLVSRGAEEDDLIDFQLYAYTPSLAAAAIFIVLFSIITILHSYQAFRKRVWLMLPFCVGGIFEVVGYIGRAISSRQTPNYTLEPYVLQTTFLLVAPALFAASIYMTLEKIVLLVDGDEHLVIRRAWLTGTFVAGDMMAFVLQGSGGGLIASQNIPLMTHGKNLALAGLVLQTVFFVFFISAGALFDLSTHRCPTPESQCHYLRWRRQMTSLYLASFLIFARSVVRIVEFAEGFSGHLISHEVYLYTFDAVLMFAVMGIVGLVHPGEILTACTVERGERESTNRTECTEKEGVGRWSGFSGDWCRTASA